MMSLFVFNKKPKTFNIFFIYFQIICLSPVTDPRNKFQNNVVVVVMKVQFIF